MGSWSGKLFRLPRRHEASLDIYIYIYISCWLVIGVCVCVGGVFVFSSASTSCWEILLTTCEGHGSEVSIVCCTGRAENNKIDRTCVPTI